MAVPQNPDLLVIGGGINGVGIARDAALRGLSVLLVERDDFGAGTSSASTKLIHGGLRYLQYREWGLVRESLKERERLVALAGHLIRPLTFVIPVYKDSPHGWRYLAAGLTIYDALSMSSRFERHHTHKGSKALAAEPALEQSGLVAALTYSDAQITYPERLCLANAIGAVEAGARVLNHTEVVALIVEDSRLTKVHIRDTETGSETEICPRITVNATGPWVDRLLAKLPISVPRQIGGTRGTHILLDRHQSGPTKAIYTPARADGRPFFVIPWREYYWVGTTDIAHDNPDEVYPTEIEVEYLLKELKWLLPGCDYGVDDVHYAQAGLRPLPHRPTISPGKKTRKHITLDHRKEHGIEGLLSVVGGKLTTYRQLAEDVVDQVMDRVLNSHCAPKELCNKERCTTAHTPLPGSSTESESISQLEIFGFDHGQKKYFQSLYGDRAANMAEIVAESSEWTERITEKNPDVKAEVVYGIRHEMARTVEDILLRRTGLGTGHSEGLSSVDVVAAIMGRELGWDTGQIERAIISYHATIDRLHRWRPD